MARTAPTSSSWQRMAPFFRPLAFLCCLLLTPLDPMPLLETLLETSLVSDGDDVSSVNDGDEMLDLSGESVRSFRRQVRLSSAPVLDVVSRRPDAARRGPHRTALPGCEHDRRNGLGAPLRC